MKGFAVPPSESAQGTIEYIVILAIIVVIALVVVSIIASFSGAGSQVVQNASTSYWISAYPIAVLGAQMNLAPSDHSDANWGTATSPASFALIVKNNSGEKITIDSITLAGGSAITSSYDSSTNGSDWNSYLIKANVGGTAGTYLLTLTNRGSARAPDLILQAGETAGLSLFNASSLTACSTTAANTMTLKINYTNANGIPQVQTGTKDLYINCVQASGSAYSDIFSPFSTTPP